MRYCFGVDVGGTTVKMGMFQADGKLLDKWEIVTRTENKGNLILPDIAQAIQEKMNEKKIEKSDIIGIGMGVPTAILKTGYVKRTANIGWEDKNVKLELEELTGLAVKVGNDANVAALGEMWKGAGCGFHNLIMVTLGTGVGGGIIIDGNILTGVNGAGGEIGHICVNTKEIQSCGCGKQGCLEQYVSATGIVRLAKEKLADNTKQTVLDETNLSAKMVFDALKNGDPVAKEIAEVFGQYLGLALANLAVALDPEIVVIGGGVSKAGGILLEYIEKYYLQYAFWANKNAKFELAKLGNDAGMYGAAKLLIK